MRCRYCQTPFEPKHPRARFCRPACRMAAWQTQREAALAEAVAAVRGALKALERLGRVRR